VTLGIDPEDLREATATGGDVWLPTGTYIEKIAGTELNQALLPDLRLGEGAMTAREGKAFEEERLNRLHEDSEAARKYLEESGAETSDVDYAKSVVRTQLEGLGIKWLGKNEAESYSTLFAAYAVQTASRWNTTVKEWVDRLNLTIRDNGDGTKSLVAGETRGQPVNEGVDLSSVAKGTVITPKFINVDAGSFLKGEGRKHLEESVIGEYRNEDTLWDIILSRRNVSHAISSALSNKDVPLNVSMEVIAELPRLIERARLVESHDDRHNGEHVRKVHRFYTAVQISTEPDSLYKVKLTVKEINEKLEVDIEGIYRAYDAKIIAKAPADPRQGKLGEFSTDHTTGAFDVILESLLDGVKDSDGNFYLSDNGDTRSQSMAAVDSEYLAAVEAGDMESAQKLVDEAAKEAGYTVQHIFHGSKRIDRLGNELKPERATSGPMPFFTDDPTIAENYSKNKADTSIEIPESYTGWFKVAVGRGKPKTIDQAWLYLSLDKRRELAAKLPHVVNTDENGEVADEFRLTDDEYGMTNKSHWEFVLREKRGNVLAAAVEIWLDSGELFDQEEKFLDILRLAGLDGVTYDSPWLEQPGVLEAHLAIRTPFDTSAISDDDFAALEAASKGKRGSANVVDEWDKRRFSGREWMDLLAQDRRDGTSFAWTSVPDWVSRELHRMGYDGITDRGGKYGDHIEHIVWIPFFPWQVKKADGITRDDQGNVIPLSQRFDAGVKDMRYQTSEAGDFVLGISEAEVRLKEDAALWGKAVDDVVSGKVDQGLLDVMSTPLVLTLAGAERLPLKMQAGKILEVIKKHNLSPDIIKSIPEAIADPVAIFRSATHPEDSVVVMVDMVDANDSTIIVPIALNRREYGYDINLLASVYGQGNKTSGKAEDWWFQAQAKAGRLLYLNTKKGSAWTNRTGRFLLPPANKRNLFSQNIPTEADLVKLKAENAGMYQGGRSRDQTQGFINRSDRGITITLTPKANKSTFLHELGHLFLWDLESLVRAGKADSRTAGDWEVVRSWWGGHAKSVVRTQLEGLGIKWLGKNEAESYSTLFAAYAVQTASRWNTTVKEWVDRLNLTIRDNGDGTKSMVAEPKTPAATPAQPAIDADGVSVEGGRVVTLGNLRPSETINPERLAAAKDRLEKAKRGEGPKREPLTVWDRGDGTYSIADGNHTYTALNEAGALSVPVKVEPVRNRAVTNIDTLYAEATKAEPEFNSLMGELQSQLGGELLMRPEMKTAESVNRKALNPDDYNGDYSRVVDVLGGSLIFETEEDLLRAVESLRDDNRIVRIKDRWSKSTPEGYRDYLLNVRLPGGYVGELQVHHRAIMEVKNSIGHDFYKLAGMLHDRGEEKLRDGVNALNREFYENALATGQSAPAFLSASSLETFQDLMYHLKAVSDDMALSDALGKILNALNPLAPSSAGSHLPSGPVSKTNALSSSESTKNSNVLLTDTTSEKIIPDNSGQSNGIVSEVVTGEGTTVQTRFRVVDASDLIASNTESFAVNKKYPKELQPRKRDRAAGISQVEKILSGLDPERLGESRMASDGAPIVGADMVVESGNGRTIALKLMYKRGAATEKARSKYISWLKENAGRFGLLEADIDTMKSPVLVRVRETDVDRAQFAKEANVASVAAMSASETARADAERMSEKILGTFRPESDLLAPENRPFVREFLSKVVPPNEWGTVTTSAGTLSRQGVVRLWSPRPWGQAAFTGCAAQR
jgi:hypothetical protein